MTPNRRLRLFGLSLAAAAAFGLAPGIASADRDRDERGHERFERRDRDDRGRFERRDRDERGDWNERHRWQSRRDHRDGRHGTRFDPRDRRDGHRHGDWDRGRRLAPRFVRHDRRHVSLPFYCRDHRHGFHSQAHFHQHLIHHHHLPYAVLPSLVAQVGFGWTFGY